MISVCPSPRSLSSVSAPAHNPSVSVPPGSLFLSLYSLYSWLMPSLWVWCAAPSACECGVQFLLLHCPEYLTKCHLVERHLVSSEGQSQKQPFKARCGISRQDLQEHRLCLYRMFLFMGLQENLVSALSAKQSGVSEHWVYFKLMASKLCNWPSFPFLSCLLESLQPDSSLIWRKRIGHHRVCFSFYFCLQPSPSLLISYCNSFYI